MAVQWLRGKAIALGDAPHHNALKHIRGTDVAKASISNAWDETRAIAARDYRLYAAIALAMLVLPTTVVGIIKPGLLTGTPPGGAADIILWFAMLIIGVIGRLAMTRMALGQCSVGEAIGEGAKRAPSLFAAVLIFIVPVAIAVTPLLPRVAGNPATADPGAATAIFLIFVLAFVLGIRLISLLFPLAVSESRNPIVELKRNWGLTSGNWWRLAGFFILFFAASMIVTRVAYMILGTIVRLAGGDFSPMSLAALVLALMLSILGAAFATVLSIMVARIYVQLACPDHASTSVPSSRG